MVTVAKSMTFNRLDLCIYLICGSDKVFGLAPRGERTCVWTASPCGLRSHGSGQVRNGTDVELETVSLITHIVEWRLGLGAPPSPQ
eukprot:scaffold292463_cov48-Prasinocladus_malaysianus.AAC.2